MIYWTDSYDKKIKRAYIPDQTNPEHGVGFPQSLDLKGLSKPTDIAVDWAGRNLYWVDVDRSGSKPKARIYSSLLDGRYRRAVIVNGLEIPTSIALDPEMGSMFWTDSGTVPRIETSWMDGSHRKIIIGDKLEFPSGITIDYAANHRIYWSDSKANSIESAKPDGSDRRVVLKGELFHPVSIDLFEDQLYWVTRDSGEVFRQDKFGRGVKVRVKRSLEHATDVKIFHKMKYNMSRELLIIGLCGCVLIRIILII